VHALLLIGDDYRTPNAVWTADLNRETSRRPTPPPCRDLNIESPAWQRARNE